MMVIVIVDVGIVLGVIVIVIVGVLVANKGRGNPNSCACTQTNSSTALRRDKTTCLFIEVSIEHSFLIFLHLYVRIIYIALLSHMGKGPH